VHCLNSELEQTRKGLENVTGSYLQQLAGIEIYLTELTDPGMVANERSTPHSKFSAPPR
jgi:hypothetical protein